MTLSNLCTGFPRLALLAQTLALTFVIVPALRAEDKDSAPKLLSTTGGAAAASTPEQMMKAADEGDAAAARQYGEALLRGDGVAKDPHLAIVYLEKAAAGGEGNASFRLGKLYDDGELIAKDYTKARRYYTAAANAGVPEAQYNLGAMYVSARGVKRDYVEGLAWLIIAAKHGAATDGEQQVRQRLTESKRTQVIAQAEKRAEELSKALGTGSAEPAVSAAETVRLPSERVGAGAGRKPGPASRPAGSLPKANVAEPPAKIKISPAAPSPGLGLPPASANTAP